MRRILLALLLSAGCVTRASDNLGIPVASAGTINIYLIRVPAGCFLVAERYNGGAAITGPVVCWSP